MSSRSFEVEVEPQVLVWARESIGLAIEDVAERFNVRENTIGKWESGQEKPTLIQLKRLASIYKRPLAVFFLSEPPVEPPLPHDFRTLPEDRRKPLSPKTRLAIRRAWRLQSLAVELAEATGRTIPAKVGRASLSDDPELVAGRTREQLGIDVQTQCAWENDSDAFKKWREAVEKAGVFVFQLTLPVEETRGFSLPGDIAPAIVLNEKDHIRARIFSLFHEYGHLLLNTGGICDWENPYDPSEVDESVEKFCNHFAGAFLVPRDTLLRLLETKTSEWSEDDLKKIATIFKVSREVILRRLVTFGVVSRSFYRTKYEEWKKRDREEQNLKDREKKLRYSFSIQIGYKQYLKDGPISEFMIRAFRDRNLNLSSEAKIIQKEGYWEIRDKSRIYEVKDNGVQLEIYKLKRGGQNVPRKCISENSLPFVSLVLDSYRKEEITYSDVADFLEIRTKHIPQVEHLAEGSI